MNEFGDTAVRPEALCFRTITLFFYYPGHRMFVRPVQYILLGAIM
jgi:hypothetical protein